jgi:hypothetical protein
VILLRLVDYVNRHTWDAFVGAATLADDCCTTPRSVLRALKSAKSIGIIEQTHRGNTGRASRYVFTVLCDTHVTSSPDNYVTPEANYVTPEPLLCDTGVIRTSEITSETLKSEREPPSSSFRNSDVGSPSRSEDSLKEGKEERESGERGPEGPKSEPSPDWEI